MGTYVRNKMFDWKILRQHKFDVPVIVVGNIAVGGTGKTPHAEYIIESLRNTYHVAFLSRGYKRRTKGFVLATSKSAPRDIGDEAYQVYHKFGGDVTVAVCENRVQGIQELLSIDSGINMLVLDDAFQHRYVKPTVAVVVTEYNRPLFADSLLPYGRLRESARGLNRADLVIVSKCPEKLTPMDYRIFSKNLNLFPYQSLFYSRYSYQPLRPVFPDAVRRIPYLDWLGQNDSVLALAGIEPASVRALSEGLLFQSESERVPRPSRLHPEGYRTAETPLRRDERREPHHCDDRERRCAPQLQPVFPARAQGCHLLSARQGGVHGSRPYRQRRLRRRAAPDAKVKEEQFRLTEPNHGAVADVIRQSYTNPHNS